MTKISKERRRKIQYQALVHIADHMHAVLSVEGPYEIIDTDEEKLLLENIFLNESNKILRRAKRLA